MTSEPRLLELSSFGLGRVGGRREKGAGDSRQNSRCQYQEAQAQSNERTQRRAAGLEQPLRRDPEEEQEPDHGGERRMVSLANEFEPYL